MIMENYDEMIMSTEDNFLFVHQSSLALPLAETSDRKEEE
jgi:hypothetical protein